MKLPWGAPAAASESTSSNTTGAMTKVHSLGATALVGGFYTVVALTLLASFAALFLAVSKEGHQAQASGEVSETDGDYAAGSFAQGFVAAWLSASSNDHSALDSYLQTSGTGTLPKSGWVYRDLATADVESAGTSKMMAVTVAANIKETKSVAGKELEGWPRRYFRAVIHAEGGYSAVGLPAPVAGPAGAASNISLNYSENVSTTSDVSGTITAFLSAYAAGAGGLERYTSPESTITPITPAPFTAAAVQSLNADKTPSAKPTDGETVHVLASVVLTANSDQRSPSTYVVTLKARAGRWEVNTLDSIPSIDPSSKTPTSATPTGRPTP